jgi:hypothetical protein
MVPSHRRAGWRRRACSLSGEVGIFEELLLATPGVIEHKVMAGETPATPATLVGVRNRAASFPSHARQRKRGSQGQDHVAVQS